MKERRQVRRRTMPFLRGGVLQVGDRAHIVTIVDLSPEGAFLATRADVPVVQDLALRTVLPGTGRQVRLPCELVWRSERADPRTGRPAGMAVRFVQPDEQARRRLGAISTEGLYPSAVSRTVDRFEYRILDKDQPELDTEELNSQGHDGWALASVLPREGGLRLVFCRRL
jgi:hypothetical protein